MSSTSTLTYAMRVAAILVALSELQMATAAEISSAAGESPESSIPQNDGLTRAQVIARIAELGGTISPPSASSGEEILCAYLSGTAVTDADIALLAALSGLQRLELSDTKITDEGLRHIASMKDLSSLMMKNTSITQAGLVHLKDMPRLSYLDVTGTMTQESDLQNLRGIKSMVRVLPFPEQTVHAWLHTEEMTSTEWATSSDGAVSLRLLVSKKQSVSSGVIILLAELRNNSQSEWIVLRPLGDEPRVLLELLSLRGQTGPLQYVGPAASYRLGSHAFALLRPGQVIRDQIQLRVSDFKGLEATGENLFNLRYSVAEAHYNRMLQRYFPDHKQELWTGELSSKDLKVTRLAD